MAHTKPYKRLWRPVKGYVYTEWVNLSPSPSMDYLLDDRFVDQREMRSLVTTAHLIIQDLYELFNYIEPADANKLTFSHRIYELLLRTATEFEANCKAILTSNDYHATGNLNIKDFFKLRQFTKLSEYKVIFNRWNTERIFQPFKSWNTDTFAPLSWYQAYNHVKHNRYSNFKEASLECLMNAIAGLLCILHVQYGENMSDACYEGFSAIPDSATKVTTGTFEIATPTFSEDDMYDFVWENLKDDANPVLMYEFV